MPRVKRAVLCQDQARRFGLYLGKSAPKIATLHLAEMEVAESFVWIRWLAVTAVSSEERAKLHDWAIRPVRAGCYSRAALSFPHLKALCSVIFWVVWMRRQSIEGSETYCWGYQKSVTQTEPTIKFTQPRVHLLAEQCIFKMCDWCNLQMDTNLLSLSIAIAKRAVSEVTTSSA